MFFRRKIVSYSGAHVCITGGSEGLGLSLAKLFLKEGSSVTIIARTLSKLEKAKSILDQTAQLNQKVVAIQGDCSQMKSISEAMSKAEAELGPVDVLVVNAGTAAPGRFLDLDIDKFESQMQLNYLGTVYSIKAVSTAMTERRKGEIIIISSALGVIGMTGYCAYAPTKWALRGLADCLRMEMQAYDVKVRIAYPPNMSTPGYENELEATPEEVKPMLDASGDTVFTPDIVADAILRGIKQDKYHLPSPDTLQSFSQSAMTGLSPSPYPLVIQAFINFICTFAFAYFCSVFDRITREFSKKRRP